METDCDRRCSREYVEYRDDGQEEEGPYPPMAVASHRRTSSTFESVLCIQTVNPHSSQSHLAEIVSTAIRIDRSVGVEGLDRQCVRYHLRICTGNHSPV